MLKLLEKGPLFREERERARKISRGIQGFGSFNQNSTSKNTISQNHDPKASNFYGRSISLYGECGCNEEDQKENLNLNSGSGMGLGLGLDEQTNVSSSKEEPAIEEEESNRDFTVGESDPFIVREEVKKNIDEVEKVDHPFAFGSFEKESKKSLLLLSQG